MLFGLNEIVMCGTEMHFMGAKPVYVLLSPLRSTASHQTLKIIYISICLCVCVLSFFFLSKVSQEPLQLRI